MLFLMKFALIAVLRLLFIARAFLNPITTQNGSDPFLVWHDGVYYLTTASWTNIRITSATTIKGLNNPENIRPERWKWKSTF